MRVELAFGEKDITVEIPENSLIDVIELPYLPPMSQPRMAVRRALESPVDSPSLLSLARAKRNAVILVPDRTRPAPVELLLSEILSVLEEGGMSRDNITIIIGLGTHRPMTTHEITELVGRDITETVRVSNHEWWNEEELVDIGTTCNGTRIHINRMVWNAELKIALGGVKPHRAAGWSGGAKMIQPGVSGPMTTGYTHWLSAHFGVEEILGVEDNPVRQEMEEIAGRIGLDFVVNYVLNGSYEMIGVSAGHYVGAHRTCVRIARPIYVKRISELADIVISGSSPASSNMWANGTGPNSAELVMKEGSTIVLAAPCPDGVAKEHPDVIKFGYRSLEDVRGLVESGEITDLCAAAHLVHAGSKLHNRRARCILSSTGVGPEEAARLGVQHVNNPQKAVDMAFARHGKNARVYVYPCNTFADFVIERGY